MHRLARLPLSTVARPLSAQLPVCAALAPAPSRSMSSKGSTEKAIVQYSSYAMAAAIPAALALGSPFDTFADYTLAVVVPGHMYLGGRSVLVDYVPDQGYQRLAIGTLGVLSAVTAIGLLKLNITDVGITEAVRTLWRSSPN